MASEDFAARQRRLEEMNRKDNAEAKARNDALKGRGGRVRVYNTPGTGTDLVVVPPKHNPFENGSLRDRMLAFLDALQDPTLVEHAIPAMASFATLIRFNKMQVLEAMPMALAPQNGQPVDLYCKKWDAATDKFLFARAAGCTWLSKVAEGTKPHWSGLNQEWMPIAWVPCLEATDIMELCHQGSPT